MINGNNSVTDQTASTSKQTQVVKSKEVEVQKEETAKTETAKKSDAITISNEAKKLYSENSESGKAVSSKNKTEESSKQEKSAKTSGNSSNANVKTKEFDGNSTDYKIVKSGGNVIVTDKTDGNKKKTLKMPVNLKFADKTKKMTGSSTN